MGVSVQKNDVNVFGNAVDFGPPPGASIHAEIACLSRLKIIPKRSTLYIARVKVDNTAGLSRPCDKCHEAIISAGIKNVIYT